ncbi:hypothetical protein G5C51_17690 [Streptomyces sp. A7024]|uniref:Secreted protein n=1 Tax=Streptomyces coryli TaxID=1128680 RepID=A0A6G4U0G4_9ACTN|nr:hypothetical protein [Streptomyces coryli]NGN65725.1 hypothetical protein [Streptomyces coryli]
MNRNAIRLASVSIVTALTLGGASGLVHAQEAPQGRPVAAAGALTPDQQASLQQALNLIAQGKGEGLTAADVEQVRTALEQEGGAQDRAGLGAAAKALWNAIKKAGSKYAKPAWEAAQNGVKSFNEWVDGLSNLNPLKWTIKAAPGEAIAELVKYLASIPWS